MLPQSQLDAALHEGQGNLSLGVRRLLVLGINAKEAGYE